MKKLTINSVICKDKTNGPGKDDVFFMVQLDGGPPIRYPVDGTWPMEDDDQITFPHGDDPQKPQFAYSQNAYVSLWDNDGPLQLLDPPDMLGNVTFDADSDSDTYDVWGVDSSRYSVDVSINDFTPQSDTQDTPVPESLQESIKQALQAWSQTPQGQQATGSTDPSTLEGIFQEALSGQYFEDVVRAVGQLPWIEAISLGITAQVEIFVGIQGDFGVVMDLGDFPDNWAVYAGGALLEGVEGGASGALNVGIWSQHPQEIGGFYEGAEVEVTDVAGLSGTIWVAKGDKDKLDSENLISLDTLKIAKAAFLGIDLGLDDGVSAEELFLFAGHLERYPTFQTGSYKNKVVLTELLCDDQHSDRGAHDDVEILWAVDSHSQKYRFPIWNEFEMDQNDDNQWQCGTIIQFDSNFDITLNVTSGVDDLKTIEGAFALSDFGGVGSTVTKKFKDGGTEYHLTAKLLVKG